MIWLLKLIFVIKITVESKHDLEPANTKFDNDLAVAIEFVDPGKMLPSEILHVRLLSKNKL